MQRIKIKPLQKMVLDGNNFGMPDAHCRKFNSDKSE